MAPSRDSKDSLHSDERPYGAVNLAVPWLEDRGVSMGTVMSRQTSAEEEQALAARALNRMEDP